MPNFNDVILSGTVVADVQTRRSAGKSYCSFKLLNDDPDDERAMGGEIEVVVWDEKAEACGQVLRAGMSIIIEGRLQLERMETAEGRRNRLKIVALGVRVAAPELPTPESLAEQSYDNRRQHGGHGQP